MNQEQASSSFFAHSRIDTIPVLAALAHPAFDIYLIIGFESRPMGISLLLGGVYAVSISWNINGISHDQHLSRTGLSGERK